MSKVTFLCTFQPSSAPSSQFLAMLSVLHSNLHSHNKPVSDRKSPSDSLSFGQNLGDGQLQNVDYRNDRGSEQQGAWTDWEEVNKDCLTCPEAQQHTFFLVGGYYFRLLVAVIWVAFSEEKAVGFITKYLLSSRSHKSDGYCNADLSKPWEMSWGSKSTSFVPI